MATPGTLFLVATPIGNLGDMSARALETLRACRHIVAEDTRRARQLLTHFGIGGKSIERLDANASERDVQRVVARLADGESIALVTDAGTPTVSDPGANLVRAAIAGGATVVPIPGPSAVLAAFEASGLAGDGRFRFVGFLPREGSARRQAIAVVCETPEAVVLFEAANRVQSTLRELADATPDREVCVARELTKLHEEFVRSTCGTLAADAREWIGETVIVLAPHAPEDRAAHIDDIALDARIDEGLARGEHARALSDRLAAWSGRPRRHVYERIIERKRLAQP